MKTTAPSVAALPAVLALALAGACRSADPDTPVSTGPGHPEAPDATSADVPHSTRLEAVGDFAALVPATVAPAEARMTAARLERVTTAVPWPRGLAWVDGELVVLARGRHRNSGGLDHSIEDRTGALFVVDPGVAEPVVPGELATGAVTTNARLLTEPDPTVFRLPDTSLEPIDDHAMDRPYCTLVWDEVSRNLFVCGFSGVDLPGRRFRKNATDSIHRFDLRTERWYPVEMHDPSVVPDDEKDWAVPNAYYPHHDPAANAAPHGWLNGPDGCCIAGDYLYALAKDNHLVVQYDLKAVRAEPDAGFPESRPVLGPRVELEHAEGTAIAELLGPSAAIAHEGWLYVGYRTTSVVVRFPLEPDGALIEGAAGQLVAVFEPWDAERGRSANLIDMAFNSAGELFVSCAKEGRIWNAGVPDPERPFLGNDQLDRPTTAEPFLDLAALTGKKTGCGNILFDDQDRLYVCCGTYDTDSKRLAGVVYRAVPN